MSKNLGLISMHVKVMTPTDRQRPPPPNPLLLVIGRVGDGDRVNVGTRPYLGPQPLPRLILHRLFSSFSIVHIPKWERRAVLKG